LFFVFNSSIFLKVLSFKSKPGIVFLFFGAGQLCLFVICFYLFYLIF